MEEFAIWVEFQIERLFLENSKLKHENQELHEKTEKQDDELKDLRKEVEKLETACSNSISEAEILSKRDKDRMKAEQEVNELRKEVLLLGELLRKYRERSRSGAEKALDHVEKERLFREAADHQIQDLKDKINIRNSEVISLKGKIAHIESALVKKDQVKIHS